jgi:cell division protein FtsI (penicillin-binding protein 3)
MFMLFCLVYFIAIANLFLIQIIQHHFYAHLAQRQYQTTITSLPIRGVIYDRHENLLALNKESISAFITPRNLMEPQKLKLFLTHHFPDAAKRLTQSTKKHFMYIQRKLSPVEQRLIEQSGLQDLKLLREASRYYPIAACSHLIGITDIDNNGIAGIEYYYDQHLAGKPTIYSLDFDGRSKRFYTKKQTTSQGIDGKQIKLTIDSDLQFLVSQELEKSGFKFKAKETACIIMNPFNGEILTMAQWPFTDPNNSKDLDINLLKNKTISDSYELGSVIKTCTALAALQEKAVTPNERIDCENSTSVIVDGRPINTVHAADIIPFWQVMVLSNNIGIAKVAKRLDKKLYDYFNHMGFGQKTGINLPGEQAGFIQHPDNWSAQSLISLSYGYEIRTTLLQLAQLFSMIANDGYAIQPHIIYSEEPLNNRPLKKKFSRNAIKTTQEILKRTTPWRAQIKGYTVMGKTGTANMLMNGVYDTTKNLYTFAGILQKGCYKRVIVTFVKETERSDLYASQVAAPLFKTIAEKLAMHDRIMP